MSLLGRVFGTVPSVSATQARELVDNGAVMVDVRSKSEWNAGHVTIAKHVPLPELATSIDRLPKGKQVVVVCRSGNRSRGATSQLVSAGFDAFNLTGGLRAWAHVGERLVDRQGRPGVVA